MNNEDRDFKGVWIPKEVYLNDELSWTEKILLIEINSLDKGGGCWASNEYFAKFLGKSDGQIANLISDLRKKGYVEDTGFDGRRRYLKADFRKTLRQGSGKPEGRVQENLNEFDPKNPPGGLVEPEKAKSPSLNNTYNNTFNISSDEKNEFLGFPLPSGWQDNSFVDSEGNYVARFTDEFGRQIKSSEITKRKKAYETSIKIKKTKAENKESSYFSQQAIKTLQLKQGIYKLDGGDNVKYAQEFREMFRDHLEKDKNLKTNDDIVLITQFGHFMDMVVNHPFHGKNATSMGYLVRNFNKIIRDL